MTKENCGNQSIVDYKVFWYTIELIRENPREIVKKMVWQGLRFELRLKYRWYFEYRAALLKVQNPRFTVQCTWGSESATGKTLHEMQKDRLRSKKAKVTEWTNKIRMAKESWNQLFPIEADEFYIKALAKLERLKHELSILETEIKANS